MGIKSFKLFEILVKVQYMITTHITDDGDFRYCW